MTGDWGPPAFPEPPARDRASGAFAATHRVAWTPGVALREGFITLGGSPWSVTFVPEPMRAFATRLHAAGRQGLLAQDESEQLAAVFMLDRGIADPIPEDAGDVDDVEVVIPVYGDAEPLERCLASLDGQGIPVTVVDDATPEPDASAIRAAANAHGARLIVRETNGGPGGARNTGFAATQAPFVAFIDADAMAADRWVQRLRSVFADPLVGALGPRVRPDIRGDSMIERYEETRSELDMGPNPSRVVYGVPVGWLPSASVMVRRSAVTDPPFEPGMRVGEDVDLFWRMDEAGWTVRYVPDVVNHHEVRSSLAMFSQRRAMYGGSAAPLEARHPRRLIPAQPSVSGLAVMAALAADKPWLAVAAAAGELARQRWTVPDAVPFPIVAELAGRTLASDAFWVGHLLRRDWWPVGAATLALTPRSRLARVVAAAMLWEPVRDHVFRPTRLDPLRSLALRALDDASYGTGVIRGAIRHRVGNVVAPRVRLPTFTRAS